MEWKKSLFFVKEATHSLCGIKHYEKNCAAKNLKALAHGPPLWREKKKGMKPRGEKKSIFTCEVVQGERKQGLGFIDNLFFFFVKCTNQREFVKVCLMLQSEERRRNRSKLCVERRQFCCNECT